MVLVPPAQNDPERLDLLDRAHTLLAPCGFGSFSVATPDQHDHVIAIGFAHYEIATPEKHDRIIAYTSQLAHVVSNAYVKSPTAQTHHGFSAGSYRDLTRVAHLNPDMWSELMIADAPYLIEELDVLIGSLEAYRDALSSADGDRLRSLLAEGDRIKRQLDDMPRPRR